MQYPSDWRVESVSNSSVVEVFFPQGNNASNVIFNDINAVINININHRRYSKTL